MITFNDVKRENHKTFYFCNAMYLHDVVHFLNISNVTDYTILKHGQLRTKLPSNITIPMVPSCIYCEPDMQANGVIISHFNTEEFHQKIEALFDSPEMAEWEEIKQRRIAKTARRHVNY